MTPAILMMITACILIAAGALGNGLEVKEVKIPQISTASRVMCFAAGFILLTVGIIFELDKSPTVPETAAVPTAPAMESSTTEEIAPTQDATISESDATAPATEAPEQASTESEATPEGN